MRVACQFVIGKVHLTFERRVLLLSLAVVATVVILVVLMARVDGALLRDAIGRARQSPGGLAVALGAFSAAFAIRTVAWRSILPGLSFGHGWSAIHVALGANHLLPLRLGEPFRVLSVVRRAGVPLEVATASTLTLRTADILTVVGIGLLVAPAAFVSLLGPIGWLLCLPILVGAVLSWRWSSRLASAAGDPSAPAAGEVVGRSTVLPSVVRKPGWRVVVLSGSAWLAESVLVWHSARWAGLDVSLTDAVLVTTVAVAAQVAAVAPGGFGTYELASVAAYVVLAHDPDAALVAALTAHGLKTGYSLLLGTVAAFVPAPTLFGRLRLQQPATANTDSSIGGAPVSTGHDDRDREPRVLLFMPAFNESASVVPCIERAPDRVLGLPVDVLIVDDGSEDDTAARAAAAGAEVISLEENRGLGAAVRVGLAEGVQRRAAAVVFCDADGEYPPEELANLVAPILDGHADYVTGSRFLGRIDHMRPHRRFGNIVLTRALSFVARTRITDGQTGYRAFSPAAAASAEIVHDFNYAQVLTLDLLAKGYRMREVPISYHFRTEGESFIKLGRYLRAVGPAVYREVNLG